jgi:hypothetical protein
MPRPDDDYEDDDPPRRRRRRDEDYEDDDYDDDDYDDRPRRRADDVDPVGFIVPTDVSGWSIVACYAGLIGFCLPLLGLPFALVGLVCGIVALRKRKRATNYGRVTSDIRAIVGVVLGGLGVLGQAVLLILILTAPK